MLTATAKAAGAASPAGLGFNSYLLLLMTRGGGDVVLKDGALLAVLRQ